MEVDSDSSDGASPNLQGPSTSSACVINKPNDSSSENSDVELPDDLGQLYGNPDNYEDDIESEITSKAKQPVSVTVKKAKKQPKTRRFHSKIPPHLKGLMGEANLRFARGDVSTAEKMCYEVIRQVPNAHEPYLTLAQIYEPHPQKSLLYHVIAAHLCPSNVDQWSRLAQISIDSNNLKHAVTYYTQAIKADPKNVELHLKRINLLETIGDKRTALRCKVRFAYTLDPTEHVMILQIAKEVAQIYFAEKEYSKAIDALNVPFEKCPDKITLDIVNMMLQLLLHNGNYSQCLDIFVEFCNIEMEVILQEDNKIHVASYTMPTDILIDLRIKFIICLIKLESFHLLPQLLKSLICEDGAEAIGDLYLDVAEALMVANRHEDALQLLVPLVKSKNYSLAAVWLKHAECLKACNLIEQAIDSYYMVMTLAPMHVEVRYPLAMLLLKLNRQSEALQVLTQDPKTQELDVSVLIKKLEVLKLLGKFDEYWKSVELLLSRHCTIIRHPEEIKAVTYLERPAEKLTRVKRMRSFRGETLDETPSFLSIRETTVDEEYKVLLNVLETCKEQKEYALMQKFAFTALTSKKFKNKMSEVSLLAFFTCIYNQDIYHGYSLIREIVIHNKENHLAWNLFNMLLQGADDIRHNRFMIRLLRRYTMQPNLKMLEANYALSIGNYKTAMKYYSMLYNRTKSPMMYFLLGVTILQIMCQRVTGPKHTITRTICDLFIQYSNVRGDGAQQEVWYNLGRMYQHFEINHLAVYYYEKALKYRHPLMDQYPELLDLRREIAYNLHLLYKEGGNYHRAQRVLYENIVI